MKYNFCSIYESDQNIDICDTSCKIKVMNKIRENLRQLGLSDKEISIYTSLLRYGKLNVSELAKKTRIKRTGLYYVLPNLLDKGLIKKTIKGKRLYYSISDPNDFIEKLHTNTSNLKKELSEFKIEKDTSVECEVLIGKQQMSRAINSILKLKKGDIVYSIEGSPYFHAMIGSYIGTAKHWQRICTEKGIVLKGVGTKDALKILMENTPKNLLKYMTNRSVSPRIFEDSELPNFNISLIAYANVTIIFLLQNDTAISIKNKTVSDSFKSLIDFIYLRGQHVNLNELIKEKIKN